MASNLPDITQFIINIGGVVEPIIMVVQAFVALIGLCLVGASLIDFWCVSSHNSAKYVSSSNRFSLPGAIAKFFVGALMLAMSTLNFVGVVSRTLTGGVAESRMSSAGLTYSATASVNEQAQLAALAILGLLQIVGLISMSKGLLTVNKHFNGTSNVGLGTAAGWFVGGMLAWNFLWFTEVLNNTIAPGAHVLDIFYFGP